MKASISKIESFSTTDGPGIRTVLFFDGCSLRCKFCHNPELWQKKEENMDLEDLLEKIRRWKPYYQKNGGITLSGGEPLLQSEFIVELCKRLKKEGIHIAIETSGIADHKIEEILSLVDLVIFDIKGTNKEKLEEITQRKAWNQVEEFKKKLIQSKKSVWIRQVIIPNVNDNIENLEELKEYIKEIDNIENIELLPFHTMAFTKYQELNIKNPYQEIPAMDKQKCKDLENQLLEERKETH